MKNSLTLTSMSSRARRVRGRLKSSWIENGFTWIEAEVESESRPGLVHNVVIGIEPYREGFRKVLAHCDCEFFRYRGVCKHVVYALRLYHSKILKSSKSKGLLN